MAGQIKDHHGPTLPRGPWFGHLCIRELFIYLFNFVAVFSVSAKTNLCNLFHRSLKSPLRRGRICRNQFQTLDRLQLKSSFTNAAIKYVISCQLSPLIFSQCIQFLGTIYNCISNNKRYTTLSLPGLLSLLYLSLLCAKSISMTVDQFIADCAIKSHGWKDESRKQKMMLLVVRAGTWGLQFFVKHKLQRFLF